MDWFFFFQFSFFFFSVFFGSGTFDPLSPYVIAVSEHCWLETRLTPILFYLFIYFSVIYGTHSLNGDHMVQICCSTPGPTGALDGDPGRGALRLMHRVSFLLWSRRVWRRPASVTILSTVLFFPPNCPEKMRLSLAFGGYATVPLDLSSLSLVSFGPPCPLTDLNLANRLQSRMEEAKGEHAAEIVRQGRHTSLRITDVSLEQWQDLFQALLESTSIVNLDLSGLFFALLPLVVVYILCVAKTASWARATRCRSCWPTSSSPRPRWPAT